MAGRKVKLLWWAVKVLLCLLAAPFVLGVKFYRWTGRLAGAWILARRDALPCPACGERVSLVGRWQCGRCEYVFDGFAFARCDVCGAVPPFVECQRCGHGVRNSAVFP